MLLPFIAIIKEKQTSATTGITYRRNSKKYLEWTSSAGVKNMKTEKAFLQLSNGDRQESQIEVTEIVEEGVHAVFIDGLSSHTLDAEFGAGIELRVDSMKSWMADYRHTEYWCYPAFGTDFSNVPEETQGLIYEKADGSFGVILPVVSDQYKFLPELQ